MRQLRNFAIALLVAGLGLAQANAASCPAGEPTPTPFPPVAPTGVAPVVLTTNPAPIPGPSGSLMAQARFFGSEDYFQAHGGDARDLVTGLYNDVLRRPPSEDEITRWVARYNSCGDGVTLAREFLMFAEGEPTARAPAVPPVIVVQPVLSQIPAPACPPA